MAQGLFYAGSGAHADRHLIFSRSISHINGFKYPFYAYLKKATIVKPGDTQKGSVQKGFMWEYDEEPEASANENAYAEGSDAPSEEHWITKTLTNNTQIFKIAYGLTGTAIAQGGVENLAYESKKAMTALSKDINKALLQNTQAVSGNRQTKGKTMGLAGLFGTHNEIDAGQKAISIDLLEALGMMIEEKEIMTTLLMNSKQKTMLNKLYDSQIRVQEGRTTLTATNIERVENVIGFPRSLEILVDPLIPNGEIVVFNKEKLCYASLREKVGAKIENHGRDAESYQHLSEGCLVWDHPYVVGRIKNLIVQ